MKAGHHERPSAWTIHGAFVLTGIVNTLIGPLLPWLTARWALSDRMAGALFTSEFAGGLAGGLASGWIAARWGAPRTMGTGMLLMAAGVAAVIVAPWPWVAAAMAIAGIGLGFVIPSMNLLVARLAPARASAALSALNLSWGAGAMSWPVAIAIVQPLAGTGAVLLALAGMLTVGAARLWTIRTDAAADEERAAVTRSSPAWAVVLFGVLIVVYSGVEMAIGGWVTEYGRRIAEVPTARTGQVAAAVFWAGLTLGRAAIAWRLTDRRADLALFAGLASVGAALAALLTVPAPLLAAGALCAGIGMAPVFPVTIAAVARACSPRIASALIATAALGGATVPWLVGAVSAATGSLALGLATLLVLLMLLAAGHAVRIRAGFEVPGGPEAARPARPN